jgi:hypothetical protein
MPKPPQGIVVSASSDITQYRLANHVAVEAGSGIAYLDFAQEDPKVRGRVVLARVAISSAQAADLAEQLAELGNHASL